MNQSGAEPSIEDIVWGYNLDTHNITYGKIGYTRNYFGNTRLYIIPLNGGIVTPSDIVAFNLGHLREKVIDHINQVFNQFIEHEARRNPPN